MNFSSTPALYVGATSCTKAYLGSTLVWSPTVGGTPPPTGAGYTSWASLNPTGLLTLRGVLAIVPTGTVLTLPEGIYEFNDFVDPAGTDEGLRIPSNCAGIWGSGNNTILRMRLGSSSRAGYVSALNNYDTNDLHYVGFGAAGQMLRALQVQGTAQGHSYQGLRAAGTPSTSLANVLIRDVLLADCFPGDAAITPGKTFGVNAAFTDNLQLINVQVAGTAGPGGMTAGAAPIRVSDSTNVYLQDVNAYNCAYSSVEFAQCNGVHTLRLTVSGNGGVGGLLHENVAGAVLHDTPTLTIGQATNPSAVHVSFNNATYTNNAGVSLLSVTHDASLNANGALVVSELGSYVDSRGLAQQQTSAPTVTKGGVTLTVAANPATANPATQFAVLR